METSGQSITQLARDLGLNDNNLYRWRKVYGISQHLDNVPRDGASMAELASEVNGCSMRIRCCARSVTF